MNDEHWNEMFHEPTEADINEFCNAASNGDVSSVGNFLNMFGHRIVDQRDRIEARAITWAAFGGHNDVINLLLNWGADVNLGGTDGKPALSWAIQYDKADTVKLLLDRGASLEVKDYSGNTPMTILANQPEEGGVHAVVEAFVEKKAQEQERKLKQEEREYAENKLSKIRKLPRPPKL